ncbi:MAG: FAD binding domain-containing protein [Rubrivivax sp.]
MPRTARTSFTRSSTPTAPCVITHPSDPAPMLVAMNALVTVQGSKGKRDVPIAEFFRLPTAEDSKRENVLDADEIVTQVRIPQACAEVDVSEVQGGANRSTSRWRRWRRS